MTSRLVRSIAVLLGAFVIVGPEPTLAQNVTWSGSTSTNWSDSGNWLGGGPTFSSTNVLVFSSGNPPFQPSNNNLSGTTTLAGLMFLNNTFTGPLSLGGNAIELSATTTSGTTLSNANTTTGRNVTIANNLVLSNAQTWSSANSVNAVTIVSGNLTGSGSLTINTGGYSSVSTLPVFRLTGANSGYTGTITFDPAVATSGAGLLLGSGSAMTGGLIDLAPPSGTNSSRNLWLTGGATSGTYTFGLSGTGSAGDTAGGRVRFFRGTGGQDANGLFLTGGDVRWNPGGGTNTDYVWATTGSFNTINFQGSNDTTPRMYFLGDSTNKFLISGDNKFFRVDPSGAFGNNPGRVTLLSALGGNNEATARTLNVNLPLLALTQPAVNNVTNPLRLTVEVNEQVLRYGPASVAITNMNQLPAGNLNLGPAGVLILDNVSWADFAASRTSSGAGNGQWRITAASRQVGRSGAIGVGGGFAARGQDLLIPNDNSGGLSASTFNTDFSLGSSLIQPDGTLYASAGVTIARDTTLTEPRLVVVGPGVGFGSGTSVVYRISGNLSGAGSLRVGSFGRGELVLAGTNSWTGNPYSNNWIAFDSGSGGLAVRDAIVRFEGNASLPSSGLGATAYLAAESDSGSAEPFGFLLTGSATPAIYDLPENVRFAFSTQFSSANTRATGATLGASGGKAVIQGSTAILSQTHIDGVMPLNLLARAGSELTLGGPGQPFNFTPTANAGSPAQIIPSDSSRSRGLVKRGPGTVTLGNVGYVTLAGSTTQTSGLSVASQFSWSIGRGAANSDTSSYFDGAVRGLSPNDPAANNSNSLKDTFFSLQGGVYEIDNSSGNGGTFTANTSTSGAGNIRIVNGGGGFSAYDGDVSVTLNSSGVLTWGANGFFQGLRFITSGASEDYSNNPLMFGSETANARLRFTNAIALNGGIREIRVIDNTSSSADIAEISGALSGNSASGINKTGAGLLELSAANTYSGTTTVSEGTLRLSNNLALQNSPLNTSGTGRVALAGTGTALTLGGLSGGTDLATVISSGYGTVTSLTLNPGSGTASYSGVLANGAAGMGVTKSGAGMQVFAAANTYTGPTTLAGGVLSLAHANALGGGGNVVFTGGTLQFTASNTGDLSSRIVSSTGAMAFDTNGQTVTFSGPLASTNVAGLTKSGSGTLVLAGANAYTGTTTVSGGTLRAGASGTPFGVGTVSLANTGGIQLDVNGQAVSVGSLIGGGTGGGVTLNNGTLTIGTTSVSGTYAGSFTGPGSVVKVGAGVFAFNPAVSSTVSGLTINQGLVSIAPSSGVTLNLGTIGRGTGGGLSLPVIATGTVLASNSLSNAIIGPWAVSGITTGLRYVTASSGTLVDYTGATLVSTNVSTNLADTTGTVNYDLSATSGTAAATFSGNTIRYTGAAGTLNPGATSFAVNGLMNAGGGAWTIGTTPGAAGTIRSGATQELVVATNAQGVTINSVIADSASGSSALTFISQGGGLTLAGANTFSGDIYMSGSGSGLTLGSGSFHAATTGNVFLSPAATLTVNNNGSQSIGNIGGLGSTFTKSGTGVLTMSSATSSFTGAATINGGVVVVSSLGMAGSASSLGTGNTINLGNVATAATLRYTGGGDTTDRVVNLAGTTGGATLEANGSGAWVLSSPLTAQGAGAKTLTLSGTSTALNSIGVIPNAVGGDVSVDKTGPGTWRLTGDSSYAGRLRVLDGTVIVGSVVGGDNPSPFGASSATANLPVIGNVSAASGTATLLTTGTVNRGFYVAEGGGAQVVAIGGSGPGVARFEFGNLIRLGRSVTLQASNGGTVEFANTWVDSSDEPLPVVGFTVGSAGNAGTVVLQNFLPNSTTGVNVSYGTLRLDYQDEFGGPIWYTTPVTLGEPAAVAGSTLVMNGIDQALSNLSFTGVGSTVSSMAAGTLRLFNDGSPAAVNVLGNGTGHQISASVALDDNSTFNVGASARLAVSGAIVDGINVAMTLAKTGGGILELSGQNTYTGNTTVDEGTLIVNGQLANGALSVAAGATLMGSGTIGGPATIAGIHSPGTSPGVETFLSDLTYSGGLSQVVWELWDNTDSPGDRGALYDGINVGGTLDFAGLTSLTLNFGGSGTGSVNWEDPFWGVSQEWILYTVSGTTTNFSNFMLSDTPGSWLDTTGAAFSTSSRKNNTFEIVQQGSDVLLVYAVPEPTTLTLAVIGIAAAAYAARRRS